MIKSLIYTAKIWLTVFVVVPIPLLILQNHSGWKITQYLNEYYWSFLGELMGFSPLVVLFFLFTLWANRKFWTIRKRKLRVLLITEILYLIAVTTLMYLTSHTWIFSLYQLAVIAIYGLVIGFGIMFYNLNPVKTVA